MIAGGGVNWSTIRRITSKGSFAWAIEVVLSSLVALDINVRSFVR